MKSLNDEIKAIKDANISLNAKKRAYAALGVTAYEISLLIAPEKANMASGIFTFGVEIECNVNRGAIRTAAESTGMQYEYQGYNHNDGHAYFKFVTDASVRGEDAIECVSPVLKGTNGKASLRNALHTLNQAGASVNRSCGLHVHIGASDLTPEQYANVFINYFHLEVLIDSFMANSRRRSHNQYCKSLRDHNELVDCHSIEDVRMVLHRDRYHKVNPMSYDRHKTIEFRQHQGSTDYRKISNWVSFCGKLVKWSKKNRLTTDITTVDEIPFLTATEKRFFKQRINELN